MLELAGGSAIALGNFDGIHLGHQEVIKTCINIAKARGLRPVVVTFSPHPVSILSPMVPHKTILERSTKLDILKSLDINVEELDFTHSFSKLEPKQFISEVLVKQFNPKVIITGRNFLFGHKRSGDWKELAKLSDLYNFEYVPLNQIYCDYLLISSSKIKSLLQSGSIRTVGKMLGRNLRIAGTVEYGRQMCRTLGFPTANVVWPCETIRPALGVYAAVVMIARRKFLGVVNFKEDSSASNKAVLEAHILGYSGNLYGEKIEIELLDFIRPKRNFLTSEALIGQIMMDIKCTEQINEMLEI